MLKEILKQAFGALRRSPLRSFLTLLGIAWGITSVTLAGGLWRQYPCAPGGVFQRHRPQRGHRLAGPDQRAGRRRARREGRPFRAGGRGGDPAGGHPGDQGLYGDRAQPADLLRRPAGQRDRSRRVPRVWRDAQRGTGGGALDQPGRPGGTPPGGLSRQPSAGEALRRPPRRGGDRHHQRCALHRDRSPRA